MNPDRPSAPLVGWMILEGHTEDMSQWDGVISFPDPTGANLAWESPIKMIEASHADKLQAEVERLQSDVAILEKEKASLMRSLAKFTGDA